ncbi:MAG: ATP-binding protein [Patescibacteria group bacterium]
MRIAFVGKGGSGKSTLCALFIQSLLAKKSPLLAIDADINMHMSELLGIETPSIPLSLPDRAISIRTYLKGTNDRISKLSQFVKTTPPGKGSSIISLSKNDPFLITYTDQFSLNAYYARVGSYTEDDIGATCYHGHLSIFENILTHSILGENEWLVADMVAGVDAFSNSLHGQFDLLVLVTEPSPEGIAVFDQFKTLAQKAGVWDRVVVVGNKLENSEDYAYLKERIGAKMLGSATRSMAIKSTRQKGLPLRGIALDPSTEDVLTKVEEQALVNYLSPILRLRKIEELHRAFSRVDWVTETHGDISGQIDPDFALLS